MKNQMIAQVRALLCALALAASLVPAVYAAGPLVGISSAAVTPGGVCSVTVTGENLSALTSLELMIAYDSAAFTVTETAAASMDIATADSNTAGFIRYSGISVDGISGTKDLLTITFLAAAGADTRDYTISVFVAGATALSGGSDQNVTVSVQNGTVTITEQKQLYFYSSLSGSSVSAGDEVTMTVSCYAVNGLAAGQFVFSYDSSLFTYESFTLLDPMKAAEHTYTINTSSPGRIMVSFISDSAVSNGDLMRITLRAKNNVSGTDTIGFAPNSLMDANTNGLKGSETSAQVTVTEKIRVWLELPDDCNTHESFTVGFWAAGASGLAAGDFSVRYDPDVLECLSVSTGLSDGTGGTSSSGYVVIDDAWQDGTINFSVLCPQGISRDSRFVVMEFRTKHYIESEFKLTPEIETTPVDRQNNPIDLYAAPISGIALIPNHEYMNGYCMECEVVVAELSKTGNTFSAYIPGISADTHVAIAVYNPHGKMVTCCFPVSVNNGVAEWSSTAGTDFNRVNVFFLDTDWTPVGKSIFLNV